jgi:putative addiction module antidote
MTPLKLTGIGNSVIVVLPKKLLAKLGVGKGDTLCAVETKDGLRLTVADAEFETQMKVARPSMHWRSRMTIHSSTATSAPPTWRWKRSRRSTACASR